jgi:hypothetical protein
VLGIYPVAAAPLAGSRPQEQAGVIALAVSGSIELAGSIPIAEVSANVAALAQSGTIELTGSQPVAVVSNNVKALAGSGSIELAGSVPVAAVSAAAVALAGSGLIELVGSVPVAVAGRRKPRILGSVGYPGPPIYIDQNGRVIDYETYLARQTNQTVQKARAVVETLPPKAKSEARDRIRDIREASRTRQRQEMAAQAERLGELVADFDQVVAVALMELAEIAGQRAEAMDEDLAIALLLAA